MNITNYSSINRYNSSKQSNKCSFKMRVSEIGRRIDEVISAEGLNQEDVATLKKMLEAYLKSTQLQDRFIGAGFHEKVFSIDDKYVLKFHRNTKPLPGDFTFNPGQRGILLEDLKSYFGNILMRFGDIKILRNVSSNNRHIPAGVPRQILDSRSNEDAINYYNNTYLPLFSSLPQKSFDRIAKDFACLNKKEAGLYSFQFDTKNPNNIVLVGTSTLRIVDDINSIMLSNPNSIAGLLDIFLRKANTTMMSPKTPENKAFRFKLFKKIILAGEKHELPLIADSGYDKKVWDSVCDFDKTGDEVISAISSLRENVKDKNMRLKYIEEKSSHIID